MMIILLLTHLRKVLQKKDEEREKKKLRLGYEGQETFGDLWGNGKGKLDTCGMN